MNKFCATKELRKVINKKGLRLSIRFKSIKSTIEHDNQFEIQIILISKIGLSLMLFA